MRLQVIRLIHVDEGEQMGVSVRLPGLSGIWNGWTSYEIGCLHTSVTGCSALDKMTTISPRGRAHFRCLRTVLSKMESWLLPLDNTLRIYIWYIYILKIGSNLPWKRLIEIDVSYNVRYIFDVGQMFYMICVDFHLQHNMSVHTILWNHFV